MSTPWPRDAFVRAVWDSSSLKPLERLVALSFADHAGDQDFAWVSYPRLRERTGLSRDAIARAIEGLRAGGWLDLKDPTRQQRSPRYWLRIPAQRSVSQAAEDVQPPASRTAGYPQQSVSRTAEGSSGLPNGLQSESSSPSPELSSPSPDTSSPAGRGDHSSHHSSHQTSGGDAAARDDAAEAVATILAAHGPEITEQQAVAAVESMDAWGRKRQDPIRDMVAFVSAMPLERVQRWAGIRATPRATPAPRPVGPQRRRCPHQVLIAADGSCCDACATNQAVAS